MTQHNLNNEVIAFSVVSGAAASTALGAAIVFIPCVVKYAAGSRTVLAGAMAMSAGVMIYVSFVEIFQQSLKSFNDLGFNNQKTYLFAIVCFFGGIFFIVVRQGRIHVSSSVDTEI